METRLLSLYHFVLCICSYPTYEEWKLSSARIETSGFNSSYPTYEEWKPDLAVTNAKINDSSYPTYEEWKRNITCGLIVPLISVLILPMRNGNSFSSCTKNSSLIVLILPMRNGNIGD